MDAEITIIGAGIVGLALSEKLSEGCKNLFLIEKHKTFGQETSSRNSEVIHAGIYYPAGSLKSRLCVEGNPLIYDFCRKYDIPFSRCGKLIVAASSEEIPIIMGIRDAGFKNGVTDLKVIERDEIKEMEPDIFALKAIFSPSTGIVDTHLLMKRLEINTLNNGAQIVYNSEVTSISRTNGGYIVEVIDSSGERYSFSTRIVINSAGLSSDRVSGLAGLHDDNLRIVFCKGNYFRLNPPKNRLIKRLIYPVPDRNLEGVGIHVTKDLSGGVKLGPDVSWLSSNIFNYQVDAGRQEMFYRSALRFLPFLEFNDLSPDMAGIRPKIQRPGEPVRDFYIKEESAKGFPGFINLIGIESPGLTSSLSIANYVARLI